MIDNNSSDNFNNQSSSYKDKDSYLIMDILLVLLRNFKVIIITPFLCCLFMIVYLLLSSTPDYTSQATFMSSKSSAHQSTISGLAFQLGLASPSSNSSEWSAIDIINSRKMAKSLLNRKYDTKLYGSQKSLINILSDGQYQNNEASKILFESAIASLHDMIKLETKGNLNILKITSFEPLLSQLLAKSILEELNIHLRDYKIIKAVETSTFIEERLYDIRIKLESAEISLKEFRENNRSISQSPQLQLEQERLSRDVSVLIGVFTTLKQQLETAKIDEVKGKGDIIVLDTPNQPLLPNPGNKKLNVLLIGILGAFIGIMIAFIFEYFKKLNSNKDEKMDEIKEIINNLF
jgi:uncharacterized protein involved in exopolysaccharide biosynthesis